MTRIVNHLLSLVSGRVGDRADDMMINRIAQGSSHDRALAAFKADQAKVASRQCGATFETKRIAK
ncbi:hypothetical protein V8J82_02100 [Gymnodinialimonas sp. 2305UL16-5]|uniref:hypothetical protein n=1 Tax=Gymnodinialimonas mytili TaxID=3126503 RepID=UPI00309C2BEE